MCHSFVVTIYGVTTRALIVAVAAALLCTASGPALGTHLVQLAPVQDVSVPFWCDWGYDWDERCYRDDGERLPVGGDDDRLWRAALRFSTASLPPGSTVVHAVLHLLHDGQCLGPRRTTRACDARPYALAAHPIVTQDWFGERELEFDQAVSDAELGSADRSQTLSFEITSLAAAWIDGSRRNSGVLLRLTNDYEDYDASGPSLPSSSFTQRELRPMLEIAYLPPGG